MNEWIEKKIEMKKSEKRKEKEDISLNILLNYVSSKGIVDLFRINVKLIDTLIVWPFSSRGAVWACQICILFNVPQQIIAEAKLY